jgi:hypothetical protein
LETFLKTARQASLPLLIPALLLSACGMPAPAPPAPAASQVAAVAGPKPGPVQWNGIFSCTAHIEGRLPAITMKGIPFRQEGDRITGLYNFTDSFKHHNSVAFSGTMSGQSARIAVTAIRADGAPNFTAGMSGSAASMTGQMMSGASQRPVRLCTLALTPA